MARSAGVAGRGGIYNPLPCMVLRCRHRKHGDDGGVLRGSTPYIYAVVQQCSRTIGRGNSANVWNGETVSLEHWGRSRGVQLAGCMGALEQEHIRHAQEHTFLFRKKLLLFILSVDFTHARTNVRR